MTTPASTGGGSVYERAHHDFREWAAFFSSLWSGTRTHEIRRDDRKPAVNEGDTVTFHEWLPDARVATGRWVRAVVGHVTRPGTVGSNAIVPVGMIVFSIRELARSADRVPGDAT